MKMVANENELRNALKESKSTWKDACNGFWASCESLYEPDRRRTVLV